ncbi:Uncharacterized protein Adt_35240 [Abeliophyllum distichum]|uniref:Uncharacterized protein n=1 Tax=Abeliophyllum distichum TaxID=126358 RepID=A0ABD1QHL9_9LAMI
MGEAPKTTRIPMEFLIMDKSSLYHRVIHRLALIDLCSLTHTKYLYMKFFTEHGIAKVRGNQTKSKACYTNVLQNFVDWRVNVINDVEMIEVLVNLEKVDKTLAGEDVSMVKPDDLSDIDPQIIEIELKTTPTENLECLPVDFLLPTKELQVESELFGEL